MRRWVGKEMCCWFLKYSNTQMEGVQTLLLLYSAALHYTDSRSIAGRPIQGNFTIDGGQVGTEIFVDKFLSAIWKMALLFVNIYVGDQELVACADIVCSIHCSGFQLCYLYITTVIGL